MIRLTCPWCSEVTLWPDDNNVEMMVYGVAHRIECEASPVDLRAEAIATMEAFRLGEGVT